MFEKREYREYKNTPRDTIYSAVCKWWTDRGFYIGQIAPYHIQGTSYYTKIGLRREFFLKIDEINGNTYLDILFKATITDEGLIGGVAATVIFWPVAAIGGVLSYDEYQREANSLLSSFWQQMDALTKQTGAPAPSPPSQPQAEFKVTMEQKKCEGCGAFIVPTWVACPYCGKKKE